jgi:hypothetical protein
MHPLVLVVFESETNAPFSLGLKGYRGQSALVLVQTGLLVPIEDTNRD